MLLWAIRFVQKDTKKYIANCYYGFSFFTEEHNGSTSLHKEHSSSVSFNVTQ